MVKLDLKDRKILYQLDLDSRQSLSRIGEKVGLHKNNVLYRIKRMQDEGVITNFWTTIDSYKLGYDVYRYYLVFQYASQDVKNEIIEHFVNYKNSWVVDSLKGTYDLAVVLWVKNIPDFYNFWDKTNDKYGDYFAEKIFSIYVQAYAYRQSYLLLEEYETSDRLKADRDSYEIVGVGEKVAVDKLEYQLLNEIAENARIPLVELAEKLGCSSQTAQYRLKKLKHSGVIQGFRVGVDISKLGFEQFKVDIYLKEPSKRKQILTYMKYNPYVTFISTSAGYADLEIEFTIEHSNNLLQVMDEIESTFSGAIKKYTYFSVAQFHKLRCIPEV